MTRRESISTLASVYIGTVIGAGFASGQEIIQFFGKYQWAGVLGVIVATLLFMVMGAVILERVYNLRIKSFQHLLSYYLGGGRHFTINLVMTLVLLISYYVMIAGGGAMLEETFGLDLFYGVIFMSALCYFTFTHGMKGIAKANQFIVPVMVAMIVLFSGAVIMKNWEFYGSIFQGMKSFFQGRMLSRGNDPSLGGGIWESFYTYFGWIWSAMLYVSFNSLSAVVMMSSLGPFIYDRKAARGGGVLGGLGLGVMALGLLLAILSQYTVVQHLEVPMMAVANSLGRGLGKSYSMVLWIAMYTTAIALGLGAIVNIAKDFKLPEKGVRIGVILLGIPFSLFGFKRLVMVVYPLFGYVGLGLLLLMILRHRGVRF